MSKKLILIIPVLLLLFALSDALFVVDETQQVVITQFGRPMGDARTSPGVHFKLPFIQEAHFFEKRFLEWDGASNQVPTKDKRFIWVDTYARWRIVDPLRFYQRVRDERGAQTRLDDIIDGETRNSVANHDLVELVRSSNREVIVDPDFAESSDGAGELMEIRVGRSQIMEQIRREAAKRAAELGVEIMDVRFKRIDYNDDVRERVYERMIAERQRIAERFRSEGMGESARIRGERERDLNEIRSEAYRRAQEVVGKADAEATTIYAEAFGRDPEFYQFLRTMESYQSALDGDSWMILSTDGEFFRFMQNSRGR